MLLDCKVILGESLTTQQKVLVMHVCLNMSKKILPRQGPKDQMVATKRRKTNRLSNEDFRGRDLGGTWEC